MTVAALTGIQSVLSFHSLFVWFYLARWVAVQQLVNSLIAHVLSLLLLYYHCYQQYFQNWFTLSTGIKNVVVKVVSSSPRPCHHQLLNHLILLY